MRGYLLAPMAALSLLLACGGSDSDNDTQQTATPPTATADAAPTDTVTSAETPGDDRPLTFAEYLAVGDCFNNAFDEEGDYDYSEPPILVGCDGPHDNEVYAMATYPDGDFPGEEAFGEFYDEVCFPELEDFLGVEPDDTALDDFYLFADEAEWEQGARGFACGVYFGGGPLQGSVNGVGNAIQPAGFPANAPWLDELELVFVRAETDNTPGDDDWGIDPAGMALVRYLYEAPTAEVKAAFLAAAGDSGWAIERRRDYAILGLETEFFDLSKDGRQIVVEVWQLEGGVTTLDYFYRSEV
ncbi:MAG TPA: septum formation family protein [Dehalococcoidia bacterium]|nr:septum formation family protein [Dehalococcoidia bacterium]